MEEHYRAFCSCGVPIVSCDCPVRQKTKIVIENGCDFCAKIAALQDAATLIKADDGLKKTLRR